MRDGTRFSASVCSADYCLWAHRLDEKHSLDVSEQRIKNEKQRPLQASARRATRGVLLSHEEPAAGGYFATLVSTFLRRCL
jgi:hypothetical protein